MSTRDSRLRRIGLALMKHAARVIPARRSAWAEAMEHELHHIESDLEALTWSVGCVLASYVERSRAMDVLQTVWARGFLMLLICGKVLDMLFATVLTSAYRLHKLGVAAFLGGFTPGDDYRRFIPLMETVPWWIHGMWVGASMLFAASGWQLFRKRRAAFPLFAAGWVLGGAGNWISQSLPASREVFSFPAPLFTRDYLIPAVTTLLPMLIAAALWAHGRCSLASRSS